MVLLVDVIIFLATDDAGQGCAPFEIELDDPRRDLFRLWRIAMVFGLIAVLYIVVLGADVGVYRAVSPSKVLEVASSNDPWPPSDC